MNNIGELDTLNVHNSFSLTFKILEKKSLERESCLETSAALDFKFT